jgi:outer membrane protein assembly factor BamB
VPGTAASGDEWTTFGGNAQRSGVAVGQPPVTTLAPRWRAVLRGQVYAEPLVVGGTVVVATEHDTVTALSARTGTVEWRDHLGTPMPGSALPCGNIDPSGITGTPVADLATGMLWAVTFTEPGIHQLVGVELANGHVVSRRTIALGGVDPLAEQQRGALALAGGSVLVPFGGLYGDCGTYRGMVASFPVEAPGGQLTFVVPARREAAIWATPGPVVAPGGSVLVATGNGSSTTAYDEGDSVVALGPELRPTSTFAPRRWATLNAEDLDLGSTSPTLVGDDRVLQVGKSGVAYLLDTANLGGIGGELASLAVCGGEAMGSTAVDGSTVLVPCRSGLTAVAVGPGPRLRVIWRSPKTVAAAPVLAAGRVWAVTTTGRLVSLDPATGATLSDLAVGTGATSFPPLAVADGTAYVAAGATVTAVGGV